MGGGSGGSGGRSPAKSTAESVSPTTRILPAITGITTNNNGNGIRSSWHGTEAAATTERLSYHEDPSSKSPSKSPVSQSRHLAFLPSLQSVNEDDDTNHDADEEGRTSACPTPQTILFTSHHDDLERGSAHSATHSSSSSSSSSKSTTTSSSHVVEPTSPSPSLKFSWIDRFLLCVGLADPKELEAKELLRIANRAHAQQCEEEKIRAAQEDAAAAAELLEKRRRAKLHGAKPQTRFQLPLLIEPEPEEDSHSSHSSSHRPIRLEEADYSVPSDGEEAAAREEEEQALHSSGTNHPSSDDGKPETVIHKRKSPPKWLEPVGAIGHSNLSINEGRQPKRDLASESSPLLARRPSYGQAVELAPLSPAKRSPRAGATSASSSTNCNRSQSGEPKPPPPKHRFLPLFPQPRPPIIHEHEHQLLSDYPYYPPPPPTSKERSRPRDRRAADPQLYGITGMADSGETRPPSDDASFRDPTPSSASASDAHIYFIPPNEQRSTQLSDSFRHYPAAADDARLSYANPYSSYAAAMCSPVHPTDFKNGSSSSGNGSRKGSGGDISDHLNPLTTVFPPHSIPSPRRYPLGGAPTTATIPMESVPPLYIQRARHPAGVGGGQIEGGGGGGSLTSGRGTLPSPVRTIGVRREQYATSDSPLSGGSSPEYGRAKFRLSSSPTRRPTDTDDTGIADSDGSIRRYAIRQKSALGSPNLSAIRQQMDVPTTSSSSIQPRNNNGSGKKPSADVRDQQNSTTV